MVRRSPAAKSAARPAAPVTRRDVALAARTTPINV